MSVTIIMAGTATPKPGCEPDTDFQVLGAAAELLIANGWTAPKICEVTGCGRSARARKLCTLHYQRQQAMGGTGAAQPERPPRNVGRRKNRTCGVDGCPNDHYSKGYCQLHYQRWKKTGDPGPAGPLRPGPRKNDTPAPEPTPAPAPATEPTQTQGPETAGKNVPDRGGRVGPDYVQSRTSPPKPAPSTRTTLAMAKPAPPARPALAVVKAKPAKPVKLCLVPECGGAHDAYGYCTPHLAEWKETGRAPEAKQAAPAAAAAVDPEQARLEQLRGPGRGQPGGRARRYVGVRCDGGRGRPSRSASSWRSVCSVPCRSSVRTGCRSTRSRWPRSSWRPRRERPRLTRRSNEWQRSRTQSVAREVP